MHDPMALAEIEMYGELVIAASASDGPLPPDVIDTVLGIGRTGAGDQSARWQERS